MVTEVVTGSAWPAGRDQRGRNGSRLVTAAAPLRGTERTSLEMTVAYFARRTQTLKTLRTK
jgi:hypothetical protein